MSSLDRLTKRARQVVHAAQNEAQQLGHAAVEPEHLLLGLVQDQQGIAGAVLRVFSVQLAAVRSVVEALGAREQPTTTPPDVALSVSAQQVLADAHTEADTRNHHYVGTEHLLLGIVHRANGARAVLETLNAPSEEVRDSVLRTMYEGPPARR